MDIWSLLVSEKYRGDVSSTSQDDGVEGLQCTVEGSSQKSTDTHVPHFLKTLCHESDTLYPHFTLHMRAWKKCDLLVLVATRIMGVFWGSGLRVGVWLQSWFSLVMLQNHSLIVYSESIHIRVGFGVGASG